MNLDVDTQIYKFDEEWRKISTIMAQIINRDEKMEEIWGVLEMMMKFCEKSVFRERDNVWAEEEEKYLWVMRWKFTIGSVLVWKLIVDYDTYFFHAIRGVKNFSA